MSTPRPDVAPPMDPPEFLQLAGHPLRWKLLSALARSDRLVSELTALSGEPQNLVSYHLAKLRDARLVFPRRSEADRRDAYYGLDLTRVGGLLAQAGSSLHPGLVAGPPGRDPAALPQARVLFLCSGNSARSQMAEALLRARAQGRVQAFSAGSHPKPLHPNAVRVMAEEYGLEIAGQASKPFTRFEGEAFDWTISLCDRVREVCPDFPGRPEVVHWSIPNPATGAPDAVTWPLFQATAAELATRVDFLIADIAARKGAPQ